MIMLEIQFDWLWQESLRPKGGILNVNWEWNS